MGAIAAIYTKEVQTLTDKINEYLKLNKVSISDLSKAINYSRSTVSRYLSGKYDSDSSEIETKLSEYLEKMTGDAVEVSKFNTSLLPKKMDFFASEDAKNVLGVCSSSQEYIGLGIVVGRSGFGKTYALKHYAKMPRVAYIECDDTMGSRDLVEAIEKALGIPSGYGSIWKRVNGIRDFCNTNKGYLIIIDEADKLISKYTQKKMEVIRGIFDQSDVGMVIAGEPKLEAQIKSYLDRFANRVDFYASLDGLGKNEVESFMQNYDVETDALEELKVRACNNKNGCFRLLDRTLNNVFRILKDSGDNSITIEVIKKASSMMML